jgi:hypothetical protein
MDSPDDETLRQAVIQDWKDHTNSPELVKARLLGRIALPMNEARLLEVSALGAHIFGEHLGDWRGGLSYLDQLQRHHSDASAAAHARIKRQEAILFKCEDTSRSLAAFDNNDRFYVTVLAVPAVTLQKSAEEGGRVLAEAFELLTMLDSAAVRRSFAVMTANLVCDLLERRKLSSSAQSLLIVLAEKSQRLWMQDGNEADWEKANFRLIQCYQRCREPKDYGSGRYPRYLWVDP